MGTANRISGSITGKIAARVSHNRPGFRGWFHRLPDEGKRQLGKFRDDYRAGLVPGAKKAIAKAVIEVAAECGWETSGIQGVIAWLEEKQT